MGGRDPGGSRKKFEAKREEYWRRGVNPVKYSKLQFHEKGLKRQKVNFLKGGNFQNCVPLL